MSEKQKFSDVIKRYRNVLKLVDSKSGMLLYSAERALV